MVEMTERLRGDDWQMEEKNKYFSVGKINPSVSLNCLDGVFSNSSLCPKSWSFLWNRMSVFIFTHVYILFWMQKCVLLVGLLSYIVNKKKIEKTNKQNNNKTTNIQQQHKTTTKTQKSGRAWCELRYPLFSNNLSDFLHYHAMVTVINKDSILKWNWERKKETNLIPVSEWVKPITVALNVLELWYHTMTIVAKTAKLSIRLRLAIHTQSELGKKKKKE